MTTNLEYLLDNDTFSNAIRGHENVGKNQRKYAGRFALSAVAAMEACRGAANAVMDHQNPSAFKPEQTLLAFNGWKIY